MRNVFPIRILYGGKVKIECMRMHYAMQKGVLAQCWRTKVEKKMRSKKEESNWLVDLERSVYQFIFPAPTATTTIKFLSS